MLFTLPLYYGYHSRKILDWRVAGKTALIGLLPLGLVLTLRATIPAPNHYDLLELFQAMGIPRLTDPRGTIMGGTIGTYGLLVLMLATLGFLKQARLRRTALFFLPWVYLQPLFANNLDRLLVFGFIVVIPLAVAGLRWFVSRFQLAGWMTIGYAATVVLAFAFISFGALVMFGTSGEFSSSGIVFARQLVDMYTSTLGGWSRWMIALVAFITMFSTTITVMDGYARTLAAGTGLLFRPAEKPNPRVTLLFMALLGILAVVIIGFFIGGMRTLVDVATVLAFLTAPLVAVLNFRVVRGDNVPRAQRPGRLLSLLSWVGIVFLAGFGLIWIGVRWLI
jgi:Mn2+/Fe2+ NRAMP family transporter